MRYLVPSTLSLGRLALVLTLFVGAAASAVAATADGTDARLRSILATRMERGPDVDAEARDAIAALGPRAVQPILRLLGGEGAEEKPEDGPDLHGPECEAIMFEALAAWPQNKVLSEIGLYGNGDVPLARKLLAIRTLGTLGRGRALSVALGLISQIEPMHLSRPFVGRSIEGSLGAILQRDHTSLSRLEKRIDSMEPPMLGAIARVLGADGRRRSIDLLATLLERDSKLDDTVLHEFASLNSICAQGASERSRSAVRRYMNHADPRVRRTAVLALGRLHDVASYGPFVELLEDEDRRLSNAALWSLRELTGLHYDKTPSEWTGWHDEQRTWLSSEAPGLGQQVLDPDPGTALAAARKLAAQSLYREQSAAYLGPAARHPDQNTAMAICSALGRLGTPAALQPLTEALDDSRPGVRRAAHRSLQEITGEALAEDVQAWQMLIAR